MRDLAAAEADPWSRSLPLHFTSSALVLHPDSGRVLLRWHQRLQKWLQAGGHADPGECDPLAIALREAAEETGLPDLVPWPDGGIKHVVVCHVPAGKGEPEHEHADLRFFMVTSEPGAARPENPEAPLRWLTLAQARELVGTNNLRHTLDRAAALLGLCADGVQVSFAAPTKTRPLAAAGVEMSLRRRPPKRVACQWRSCEVFSIRRSARRQATARDCNAPCMQAGTRYRAALSSLPTVRRVTDFVS